MPPPFKAWLPENVLSYTASVPWLKMPPPLVAMLPEKVQPWT
jgi:hypothetical protein